MAARLQPVTLVQGAALPLVPWNNGAGSTREIASGAALADASPVWRLSLATIDRAAPFSVFAGMDRLLAVVAGSVALTGTAAPFPAAAPAGHVPLAFAGELIVAARPLAGPALVLNLMTRRGAATATLDWRDAGWFQPAARLALVFAPTPITVSRLEQSVVLAALDTLRLDNARAAPVHVDGRCLIAEVRV